MLVLHTELSLSERTGWRSQLDEGLERSRVGDVDFGTVPIEPSLALQASVFRDWVRFCFGYVQDERRRVNVTEVLVRLARVQPKFMVGEEGNTRPLAVVVVVLPDVDEATRNELNRLAGGDL